MARIKNSLQTPIYGIISRKDLPNAPSGTYGYEIIKVNPGETSPKGLDVDWVTNKAPKNDNGTLRYDKSTEGFKIRDTWGVDTGQEYDLKSIPGGLSLSGPAGGGSVGDTVGSMNFDNDIDDDNGFDVRTYQSWSEKAYDAFWDYFNK